ncbi:hypothetical protein C1646_661879 [Rhizophagus diaphanus]|nr:hypothetical protein C1646_661879 [Rhizophagus diaphanus] [Rhizophagus sp. MUCL 43196]
MDNINSNSNFDKLTKEALALLRKIRKRNFLKYFSYIWMFIEEMTQKSRSVAFGVPVSATTEQRKRVMNDQYLFPREAVISLWRISYVLYNRDILFERCEMTQSMYILGINIMEGLANFLYHPEKRRAIKVDELERQAREEAAKIKITKA